MAYKKDDIVELDITDLGTGGEGIGRADGYTVFVKDALIGDRVEAKIIKAKKNYGYGRLTKIINPSNNRIEPRCSVARQCGGCQIQQMSYKAQLDFKRELVKGNLERIGGFTGDNSLKVLPVIGMDSPFNYRNKAQYPVGTNKNGEIIMGFYAGRTHSIIDNIDCSIGASENVFILQNIKTWMEENNIPAYDENNHTGLVRHVLIRTGFTTGQIMVCLVINADGIKSDLSKKLVDKLLAIDFTGIKTQAGIRYNENLAKRNAVANQVDNDLKIRDIVEFDGKAKISSIMINVNKKDTNVILGEKSKTLYGNDYIIDYIDDIKFQISPLSFFQVNPIQTEVLYGKALEFADLSGGETVWDMYCGIGTISLFLAKKAKEVYGVEIVPQAIEDAKNNAKINNICNANFYVGRAEEVVPDFYNNDSSADKLQDAKHPDVVVVDPPRKGCDEVLLNTLIKMAPNRLVYVSCDSATLARDLKKLSENGFKIEKVQPVDMFPHTVHVETVCLMSRVKEK